MIRMRLSELTWHEECEPQRLERMIEALRVDTIHEPIHVSASDKVIRLIPIEGVGVGSASLFG